MDLDSVIEGDLESFLDVVSELMVGTVLLQDITWRIVGIIDERTIELEVTGDVSFALDDV